MGGWEIAGVIASILGAAVSIWQASRAKRFRDEIHRDRKIFALVELLPSARASRDECKKIRKSATGTMRGVKPDIVLGVIQNFAESLQEQSHRVMMDLGRQP